MNYEFLTVLKKMQLEEEVKFLLNERRAERHICSKLIP